MQRRRALSLFGVLLFGLALLLGVWHEQHEHGTLASRDDCPTCAWLATSVTTVIIVFFTVFGHTIELVVPVRNAVLLPQLFPVATASRAPPLAST